MVVHVALEHAVFGELGVHLLEDLLLGIDGLCHALPFLPEGQDRELDEEDQCRDPRSGQDVELFPRSQVVPELLHGFFARVVFNSNSTRLPCFTVEELTAILA